MSVESDSAAMSQIQQRPATSVLRKKCKTLEQNSKVNPDPQAMKSVQSSTHHQTNLKQRSGITNHSPAHRPMTVPTNPLPNASINKRFLNRLRSVSNAQPVQDSSSPWIINESHMDFPEFVELFKSFYFHCRRDLKDLFNKFAMDIDLEQDFAVKEQHKNDLLDIPRHLTGLITRNILDDITDASIRRIYDMIAISSIPCYAVSTHTRGNCFISKEQFREFLLEHQKEDRSAHEIEQIIYVRYRDSLILL